MLHYYAWEIVQIPRVWKIGVDFGTFSRFGMNSLAE